MKSNIIITGMMGVGKTTVGRKIARSLNKRFIDLDETMEQYYLVDAETIFSIEGEDGFRSREHKVLLDVLDNNQNFVLSLGGGTATFEGSGQVIANNTSLLVIELYADAKTIVDRISKSSSARRPILSQEKKDIDALRKKVSELIEMRKPYYQSIAHASFDTSGNNHNQVISNILDYINSNLDN